MSLERLFFDVEMPLWPIVEEMRTQGLRCDTELGMRMELECLLALEEYKKQWASILPGIDYEQDKELLQIFIKMGLPVQYRLRKDRSTGRKYKSPTVDKNALELYRDKYGNELAKLVLLMRKLKKASDFCRFFGNDGKAHPQLLIHRQAGGRLQAKEPDMQNIPEKIINIHPRRIVIPDADDCVLIGADYEAAEFYTYGWYAKDPEILGIKLRGEYIHGILFEALFGKPFFQPGMPKKKVYKLPGIDPQELLAAKTAPLGMIYGRDAYSLIQDPNLKITAAQAQEIHSAFHKRFAPVFEFHNRVRQFVKKHGFVRNVFGRIRRIPSLKFMENEAFSFFGQSTVADILKRYALIKLHAVLQDFDRAHLRVPVHDQVIISAPKKTAKALALVVKDCMETPIPEMPGFYLSCVPKIGSNWYDMIDMDEWKG